MKCLLCHKLCNFDDYFSGDCPKEDLLRGVGHIFAPVGELDINIPPVARERQDHD